MKEQEREELHRTIWAIANDPYDGLTPTRAAPCGGGTGLTPAQPNRRRR